MESFLCNGTAKVKTASTVVSLECISQNIQMTETVQFKASGNVYRN